MLLLSHNDDTAIDERLTSQLAEVEARFTAELMSDLPCVNSLVDHVERYGGKRLRPMLVLVTGTAAQTDGAEPSEATLVAATVVEMVHMATLVHDDVLDDAQMRRGGWTINHLRGNEAAVMLGDYLISHAYHLCSSLNNTIASRIIADATNTVCEGELLQLANRGNLSLDERTYFEIIRRKTGSLCGACCRLGAVLNNASPDVADQLYDFGEKLGVAFQIVDDLLDLIGSEQTVGKTLGKDLQKGKLTLPLLHWLKSAGADKRQRLSDLMERPVSGETGDTIPATPPRNGQAGEIRRLIVDSGSVDYASQWAGRLIEQAKASLNSVDDSPSRSLLVSMADAVLTRNF